MKKRQIVIVTEEFDPHTDVLLRLLRGMGQDPVRIHSADFPLAAQVLAHFDGTCWQGQISTPRRTLNLAEIRSIWWRRPRPARLSPLLSVEEKRFAAAEMHEAFQGIWYELEQECYWVSFPAAIRKASFKLGQLRQATRLGLQVPRTLVTTDPDEVRHFYEKCQQRVIYKTLSNPHPQEEIPKAIYTTPLQEEQLARLDTLGAAPGLFQEYIPKQIELRVTVIGDEIFAAEIHSQVHQQTRDDWRHYEVLTPMQSHPLPVEIAEKCFALTKGYGLNFSTSDMILTPEGRYVFLEMNPNGQWLWVQERIPELKMKEALAACLVRGSNG